MTAGKKLILDLAYYQRQIRTSSEDLALPDLVTGVTHKTELMMGGSRLEMSPHQKIGSYFVSPSYFIPTLLITGIVTMSNTRRH